MTSDNLAFEIFGEDASNVEYHEEPEIDQEEPESDKDQDSDGNIYGLEDQEYDSDGNVYAENDDQLTDVQKPTKLKKSERQEIHRIAQRALRGTVWLTLETSNNLKIRQGKINIDNFLKGFGIKRPEAVNRAELGRISAFDPTQPTVSLFDTDSPAEPSQHDLQSDPQSQQPTNTELSQPTPSIPTDSNFEDDSQRIDRVFDRIQLEYSKSCPNSEQDETPAIQKMLQKFDQSHTQGIEPISCVRNQNQSPILESQEQVPLLERQKQTALFNHNDELQFLPVSPEPAKPTRVLGPIDRTIEPLSDSDSEVDLDIVADLKSIINTSDRKKTNKLSRRDYNRKMLEAADIQVQNRREAQLREKMDEIEEKKRKREERKQVDHNSQLLNETKKQKVEDIAAQSDSEDEAVETDQESNPDFGSPILKRKEYVDDSEGEDNGLDLEATAKGNSTQEDPDERSNLTVNTKAPSLQDSENILSLLSGTFGEEDQAPFDSIIAEARRPEATAPVQIDNSVFYRNSVQISQLNSRINRNEEEDVLALLSFQPKITDTKLKESNETPKHSDESAAEDDLEDEDEGDKENIPMTFRRPELKKTTKSAKSRFIEAEAEVEEDEFMNFGGIDGEDFAGIDEYETDMLADNDKSKLNEKKVIELHRKQVLEEDQENINNILNDVTSGNMRKRRGRKIDSNGQGLDLYDSDEENEAILRQIRKRMGLQSRKKDKEEDGTLSALGNFELKQLPIPKQKHSPNVSTFSTRTTFCLRKNRPKKNLLKSLTRMKR
jgi:hypothetical protein